VSIFKIWFGPVLLTKTGYIFVLEVSGTIVNPVGPVGPVSPVLPVGPVLPVLPVGPVSPVGPVLPVGPVSPVLPVGPVSPWLPKVGNNGLENDIIYYLCLF
jgi:hypothetical protein